MTTRSSETATLLRIASVGLIAFGAILLIAFYAAVQRSFGSFGETPVGMEPPEPSFALAVAGMLMLVGGIALARFAFLRPVASYVAGEISPAVEAVAQSAATGVAAAGSSQGRACLGCGVLNDRDAAFCDACGRAMG